MKQEIITLKDENVQKQVADLLMRGGRWHSCESYDGCYCEFDPINYPESPFRFIYAKGTNGPIESAWTCKQWTKYIEPIEDKWPSMLWDTHDKYRKYGFYDKINDCAFSLNGSRNGFNYQNIIPLKKEEVPEWMWKVQKDLED